VKHHKMYQLSVQIRQNKAF